MSKKLKKRLQSIKKKWFGRFASENSQFLILTAFLELPREVILRETVHAYLLLK